MKGLHEDKFGSIRDQEIDQDGMKFIVTCGITPSMATPEQSLNKAKGLYQDKFGSTSSIRVNSLSFTLSALSWLTMSQLTRAVKRQPLLPR